MSRVSVGNLDPRASDRELEHHGAVASRFVPVFLAVQRILFSRFSFLSCRVCLQAGFVLRVVFVISRGFLRRGMPFYACLLKRFGLGMRHLTSNGSVWGCGCRS